MQLPDKRDKLDIVHKVYSVRFIFI